MLVELKYENLSENQKRFVDDAEEQEIELHDYSGQFMDGMYCPAVMLDDPAKFHTNAQNVQRDRHSSGQGYVIYCVR